MHAHFQSRLEQAFSQDFRLLRRIPSTGVWRTLGYFCSLTEAEQLQLLTTFASIARENVMTGWGFSPPDSTSSAGQTAPSVLFHQVFSQPYWSEFPDRFLRQFGASADTLSGMIEAARMPAVMAAEPPVIAKAGAIRKVLHRRLKETFAAKIVNCGGGAWRCTGGVEGTRLCLSLDYGGRGSGFRYGVGFPPAESPDRLAGGVTLESSCGFPAWQNWDFPLTDELEEIADTLCEVVVNLAQLHAEIMARKNA